VNVEFVGTKVAVVERRAGARELILAMRRGSEVSDGLRSPEPAMPELEISWVSEERAGRRGGREEAGKGAWAPLCQRHAGVDGRKNI
jgi:hypothetical protein